MKQWYKTLTKIDYVAFTIVFIMLLAILITEACSPILNEDNNTVCIEIYQPVCYKGKLYDNSCYAEKDGADNEDITPSMCIDYEPGYTGEMKPCPFCP